MEEFERMRIDETEKIEEEPNENEELVEGKLKQYSPSKEKMQTRNLSQTCQLISQKLDGKVPIISLVLFALVVGWIVIAFFLHPRSSLSQKQTSEPKKTVSIFKWNATYFNSWHAGKAEVRIEQIYRLEKIPYPGLILAQDRHKPSPKEHYPEAFMWLKKQALTGNIFVQKAPTYLILLMLAATENHVNFIIPPCQEQTLILENAKRNNFEHRLILYSQDEQVNQLFEKPPPLQVTTYSEVAQIRCEQQFLFYSEGNAENPSDKIFKIVPKQDHSTYDIQPYKSNVLSKGFYLIEGQQ